MKKENLIQILEDFQKTHKNPELLLYGYKHDSWKNEPNLISLKGFHSQPWIIGGQTGGNPWNDADRASEIEDSEEIHLLDEFLEEYYPHITFLKYKRLMRLVKDLTWEENEYYGNINIYKCAYITFEDIASCLEKMMYP